MNFRYAAGAQIDLFDLADWFEAQSPGSGARFSAAFHAFVARIRMFPRLYHRVGGAGRRDVRVGMPNGFLALVHYEVTVTEVIILSVVHARSRHRPWRSRLAP